MYQFDDKTVIRAGYGRSFDTGVFGSIFGHVVTQNLPVLADQSLNEPAAALVHSEFELWRYKDRRHCAFPTVPTNGLLPARGYKSAPKARPNPLHFPTIDAWNLSVQRAIYADSLTYVGYVGNKGTHTLGDGDDNNTNPNEAALALPGQYSVTGQTLNWDPRSGLGGTLAAGYSGGVSNGTFLERYYGGSLAACRDPNYIGAGPTVLTGTLQRSKPSARHVRLDAGHSYYGDDQNTEFNALQITLAKHVFQGSRNHGQL